MPVSINDSSFVTTGAEPINLSSMVSVTASTSNPEYLVVSALDRNEYTAGASEATGTFTGNGHTESFTNGSLGDDGRYAGIVFTYNAATGEYVNSTYGNLANLTYNASSSLNDVTNISFYGTNSLSAANSVASSVYNMIEGDQSGYIGSTTVANQPSFSGAVPSQATPDSVAAVAESFVGKAWNMDGCWVLASTIAAEAGAGLPVTSNSVGTPGHANGEWFVAYNGPVSASSNWESQVTAGEIVVIGSPTVAHITTCVSGSGSTAMLVDNITYENNSGQILNSANDGSSNDVIVSAAHAASQEWSGIYANMVVIYELDCPIVSDVSPSASITTQGSVALSQLFSAVDPNNKTITAFQVYDTSGTGTFTVGGVSESAHSAATAVTTSSLSTADLVGGTTAGTDTVEVRAYNGSYWGDWQTLNVNVASSTINTDPINTNTDVTQNGVTVQDSGTFTVSGTNDTIIATAASTITVSGAHELFFLAATNSSIDDSSGSGDLINGHGVDYVILGNDDAANLFGGQNETVIASGNDIISLSSSGIDTLTLSGNNNNVTLGASGSTITISSGSNDNIGISNQGTFTIVDNGSGSVIASENSTINLSGAGDDTIYAKMLGTHIISLGSGSDMIVVRDGTILPHDENVTLANFVDGIDKVELNGGAGILTSTQTVMHYITNVNGTATFTLGGEVIKFAGMTAVELHASDFVIA